MFLNLVMLAGLGGAAVPLVLHLLARARYRTLDWGGMMFLEGIDAQTARRSRLKQWLLLAMRMALVALVAMALARPVAGKQWELGPQGQVTAVIVMDRSYSMGFEEAGRPRFHRAREAALQIVSSLRKGDEVGLVLLGDKMEVKEPNNNLQAVAREVAELSVSGSSADLRAGLDAARKMLDQPGRLRRELYVVTDRQALSWESVDRSGAFGRWVTSASPSVRFYVVPVGGEQADNVAIESVELVETVAIVRQPTEVEVKIRNYSPAPRVGVELSVRRSGAGAGGDGAAKTMPVTVPAMGAAAVRVPLMFERVGSSVITAQIKAQGLEPDKRLDLVVDAIEPIETMIISGDERPEVLRRESFFLALALGPMASVGLTGDPAKVSVKGIEELSTPSPGKEQVIILANVPQLTAEQARALEQRVYEGSGLIICPGNLTRVEHYNTLLYRDGMGIMPARLEAAGRTQGSPLLGLELTHPIFRFRRGTDPLPAAVIGRYFPATPRPADAKVLGTYASGEPFLVEGPRGRGRVLLVTTPLDADWNTLPLYPFYLPFVQSMVRYVHAPALADRNLLPGEPIVVAFEKELEEVTITLNDAPPEPLAGAKGRTRIRYEQTHRPGVYRVRARLKSGADRVPTIHFAVQPPRREADLKPLSPQQWEELEEALGFIRIDADSGMLGTTLAADRGGRELWLVLLMAALGLGVAEIALTRWWSKGEVA